VNKLERKPISVLPQDEKVVSFFGDGPSMFCEPRLKPFKVDVRYQNLRGKDRSGTFELDVSEFDGLVIAGKPANARIAESMKGIEDTLKSFTRNGKLKVVSYSPDDMKALEAQEIREFDEFQASIKSE
jgi:hypothetical protein